MLFIALMGNKNVTIRKMDSMLENTLKNLEVLVLHVKSLVQLYNTLKI